MITFKIGQARFVHRVAGICIHEGHVLLQRSEDDSYWFLPGGRIEVMESSEEAIKREMREELKLDGDVQVERLLWVVENLFIDASNGKPNHELGLYYLISFGDHPGLYDTSKPLTAIEDTGAFAEEPLMFMLRWFALEALDDIPLYPTFLKAALRNLPTSIQHIVHRDPDESAK
jgi:ADP-ribose pyrophosphatase YjhB (NUDIX family)